MKKYTVIFHSDAETDISESYNWGCRVWGEKKAVAWVRELQRAIKTRLTSLPESCPLAPESDDLNIPVRQLVAGRYRVLFIVEKKTVTILHVKGAYLSSVELIEDDD